MLNAIIRFALHQRLLVVVFSLFLMVAGGWQAIQMDIDVFPNLNRPRVVVMVEAPGMAPEEVEAEIVEPQENVLRGLPGMVELLTKAGLTSGDTIAVMLTGSMPGANMAMLIACDALDIHPIVITSIGASQWGANDPDMTWLDMEKLLFDEGLISIRSIAASIGGRNDQGRLLSPKGRELIRNNISEHGLPLITGDGLKDNIQKRMDHFGYRNYKAVVNVGGGVASLGTSFNLRLLPPGIIYRKDIEAISRSGGIDGSVVEFIKRNIPLIHVLNIQNLTEELGMAFAPIPLPEIGKGSLYAVEKYSLTVTMLSFLLVSGMVFGVGWRSHQQIKQRMMDHEPDSVI